MCGIAGYIDFTGRSDKQILMQMSDALMHRGPDDSGYEIFSENDYSIGLGFRRLSIIDLSPLGHQPMFSTDGNLCIIFNGEIYNYKEIRAELEKDNFKSPDGSEGESRFSTTYLGCNARNESPPRPLLAKRHRPTSVLHEPGTHASQYPHR